MSSNPLNPSFRYPASIDPSAAHPTVVKAVNQHTKGIVDLNQAIAALKQQVNDNKETITTVVSGGTGGGTPGPPGPPGAANLMYAVPSGTLDGVNKVFTVPNTPIILWLTSNGVKQVPTVDYTISANTITYTVAPKSFYYLEAIYSF